MRTKLILRDTSASIRYAYCVPAAYRLRTGCVPAAYRLRTRCVSGAYLLRTVCVPSAYRTRTGRVPYAYHMRTICVSNEYRVRTACVPLRTICVPLRTICVPYAYHMRTIAYHVYHAPITHWYASGTHPVRIRYASGTHPVRIRYAWYASGTQVDIVGPCVLQWTCIRVPRAPLSSQVLHSPSSRGGLSAIVCFSMLQLQGGAQHCRPPRTDALNAAVLHNLQRQMRVMQQCSKISRSRPTAVAV